MKLHEIDYSDLDIMIVELPKNDQDYVFAPLKDEGQQMDTMDPLDGIDMEQNWTADDFGRLDI